MSHRALLEPLSALLLALTPVHHARAQAHADTARVVRFGALVDVHYAHAVGRPRTLDRSFAGGTPFTTQPARHAEFNVNLAFVDAVLTRDRVRGRLALQAGTSVQANYAGEPTTGNVSGPALARHLQEAWAGYRVHPSLWIDAGVYFALIGMESWISRDNSTYTRSLVAEYSPYYASGVRASWHGGRLSGQLHLVNGWQNISETNTGKSVGARVELAPGDSSVVAYYALVNGETGGRLRAFNGLGARWARGRTTLLANADAGWMERGAIDSTDCAWWGGALVVRRQATARVAIAARVERFDDPGQVVLTTGLPAPFRGNSASLGVDVAADAGLQWRTEVRAFRAGERVFPAGRAAPRTVGGLRGHGARSHVLILPATGQGPRQPSVAS
jgi:hypothetical protein